MRYFSALFFLSALLLVLPGHGLFGAEPRDPGQILTDLQNLQKIRNAELLKSQAALQESRTALAEAQTSLNHLATATENLTLYSQSLASALAVSRQESETLRLWSTIGLSVGGAALVLGGLAILLR